MKFSIRISNNLTGLLADYAAKILTEDQGEVFSVVPKGVTSNGEPATYLVVKNSNRKVAYSLGNYINSFDCSHNGMSWAALKKAEEKLNSQFPNLK